MSDITEEVPIVRYEGTETHTLVCTEPLATCHVCAMFFDLKEGA